MLVEVFKFSSRFAAQVSRDPLGGQSIAARRYPQNERIRIEMRNRAVLLALSLPCWLSTVSGQVTHHDKFPLAVHREWRYEFASEEREYLIATLRRITTNRGIVSFMVLDQTTSDTLQSWNVKTAEYLETHVQDVSPFPRDSTYSIVAVDTFTIHESLLNDHQLVSDSCTPLWSFPRRWYAPTQLGINPVGSAVYRYSSSSESDTICSSTSELPLYFKDTVVVANDIGITWASSACWRGSNNRYSYVWQARLLQGPTTVTSRADRGLPEQPTLYTGYPNPFNPSTRISYSVPSREAVTLTVYDVLGRTIATLASGVAAAGYHSVVWNATGVPSGTYLCCLRTTHHMQIVRLCLVR